MKENLPYGVRFSVLHRAFRKQIDKCGHKYGLTGVQFLVLRQLMRLENSEKAEIFQKDLETALHLSHPTMTEILKRLETKGYICCRVSSHDRRCKSISSTEKSSAFLSETEKVDTETFHRLCRGLSPVETEQLQHMMHILVTNALHLLEDEEKGADAK